MSIQNKRGHLRKPHFLSNMVPSDSKQEFEELRNDIFCEARTLLNWEEHLPVRWIVLEKEIFQNKSKKTMLYTEAEDLATECSFPDVKQTPSELSSFLNFEHEIGNIIFFKDVREYIVLDPEWLVDVFRCFVSHDYHASLYMTEWATLVETGKLEEKLVEKLLKKVPSLILSKHKQYILELMEKFGIIVKPNNDDFRNNIYMPCMIKPRLLQEICGTVNDETEHSQKTSWFCLKFNFLPPSYFNHILVSFVRNKQLFYNKKDKKLGIYRNIGIFELNTIGSERLVICLSKNVIAMQVLQLKCSENVCYSNIKQELIKLVSSIKQRYRIHVTYEIRFKCPGGSLFDTEGIGYDEAIAKSEYGCTDHNKMHLCKDIYRHWMKVCKE